MAALSSPEGRTSGAERTSLDDKRLIVERRSLRSAWSLPRAKSRGVPVETTESRMGRPNTPERCRVHEAPGGLDSARPGCIIACRFRRGDAGGGETPMKGSSVKPAVGTAGRRAFLVGVTAACAATGTRGFGQTAPPVPPPTEGGKLYRTAGDLVADLAARRVSSVDLLDQAIARIERLHKSIKAVVVRDFDRARQAALPAHHALARGERRPVRRPPGTAKE